MNVEKLLTDPLIVDSDASLSKVISAMEKARKREAIVLKGGEYAGMVEAKDILRKQVGNPDEFRIDGLVKKINMADGKRSLEELAVMMLTGDYSELPYYTEDGIKALSKNALMGILDKSVFSDNKAKDIMNVPYFVNEEDNIDSVKNMLLDLNVSKIPVVNEDNKITGLVDTMLLLNTVTKRSRASSGERAGEKTGSEGVNVSSFMDKNLVIVAEEDDISKVLSEMERNNSSCVLVEKNGLLAGIITPKDILKLAGERNEGVYMNFSGYKPEDEMEYDQIKELSKKTLEKASRMARITYAAMHIEKHDKGSVKSLYTVSARLGTHVGLFRSDYTDWDVVTTVKRVMEKIMIGLEKDMDKRRTLRRVKG